MGEHREEVLGDWRSSVGEWGLGCGGRGFPGDL